MSVVELKDTAAFTEALQMEGAMVVDFSAPWCGPCKVIAPKYAQLAAQSPAIRFYKIDTSNCVEVVKNFKITGVPTFLFFLNGQLQSSFAGANLPTLQAHVLSLSNSLAVKVPETAVATE